MNIKEVLMLLNCIILGVTTITLFYKATKLDVFGDGYEANKRNRQGTTFWLIASVFVGVLALPVMVLRKIYQWKRYKLPNIEWDDICRYGFAIIVGSMLHIMLAVMTSCSTPKPVVVERVINKTDTLYKTNYKTDTFRVHDSIYVESYMIGDTMYKTKNVFRWRDRVSIKTDTIYRYVLRTDSIPVPTSVEYKATWWERTQMRAGKIALGTIVLSMISLMLWLVHRKK